MPLSRPGHTLPFFYGTFTNIGLDYLVPPQGARALLGTAATKEQLSAAVFDGKACLSLNYQQYFAQFARGSVVVQEIELNVVAFPTKEADVTPVLSYRQYAAADDSTRRLGFCRMHVACDNDLAISAGQAVFGLATVRKVIAGLRPAGPRVGRGCGGVWSVAGRSGHASPIPPQRHASGTICAVVRETSISAATCAAGLKCRSSGKRSSSQRSRRRRVPASGR